MNSPRDAMEVGARAPSRGWVDAAPGGREDGLPRSGLVELLLCIAVAAAFLDESIRKVIPGNPVIVTAFKDLPIFAAGLLVLGHLRQVPYRYLRYFAIWSLVGLASATWVFGQFYSVPAFLASVRTYCLAPLIFAAGYYLGRHDRARTRIARLFLLGTLVAITVAVLQEYSRESLPAIFSNRIYFQKHDEAGGFYNESVFASPQIFCQLMVVITAWSFGSLTLTEDPRGRFRKLLFLLLSFFAIYLSRIRTGLVLAGFAVFVTWLVGKRVRTGPGEVSPRIRMAMVGLALAVVIFTMYVLFFSTIPEPTQPKLLQDRDFFATLFSPDVIRYRAGLFWEEIQGLTDHDAAVGYGAGTGGSIRVFLEDWIWDVPAVRDTGIFLVYHEMGWIGIIAFLIGYGGLTLEVLLRLRRSRDLPRFAIPAFSVAAAFLLWFLLKSHAVISNGVSHSLWVGMLGLACAGLDRGRAWTDEIPDDPRPEGPDDAGDPGRP